MPEQEASQELSAPGQSAQELQPAHVGHGVAAAGSGVGEGEGEGDGFGGFGAGSSTPTPGDGGDEGGPGTTTATVGTASTEMPSAGEAAAGVAREEASDACMVFAVVEAGTPMVAVMSTEAAVTLMVTSEAGTPAREATSLCSCEVSA